MSIQFNMTTNVQELGQEEFMWGMSNSDGTGNGCRSEKQLSPSKFSQSLKIQIPTIKKITKGKKRTKRNHKNHIEESPDHEIHIWTERERRKKMRDMFAKLHALLPQLPPKADKSTIVDEAVSSIKTLEQTLQKLQMQKLEKLHHSSPSNTAPNHPQILPAADSYSSEAFLANQIASSSANLPHSCCNDPTVGFDTWSSRNVVLNICGNEAFFNLCCPKNKPGVFTRVCYLLKKYNIEVLFANVSSNVFRSNYMIQAQVNLSDDNQLLADGFGVGVIFKQAAQELVLYFSSP